MATELTYEEKSYGSSINNINCVKINIYIIKSNNLFLNNLLKFLIEKLLNIIKIYYY